MNEKILPVHLERAAYVYVRQSTQHQVRHNLESQRRQYGLADHAKALGFRDVVVIDEDLGRSGSGTQERPGFGRLLAAVCEGVVGAVVSIEASRLARNNRDWHHLVDLCALTDTLVVDPEGVYDPKRVNDRLLLGLKGTMSEFELSLIRQRGQEALKAMLGRGEVLFLVPIGYVRTRDNRCEMTPDRQIQQAIRGVFAKFAEVGSARQTLLWYRQEKLPVPTNPPDTEGAVVWMQATYRRIHAILKNPIYAGAFVYGRRATRTVVVEGRARKSSGHDVPRQEWKVVLLDHHAGYIAWDTYLRNQEILESNAASTGLSGPGAAKSGPALLAGLLRCARCGRKLHVTYSGVGGRVPRYGCRGGNVNHGVVNCISVGGLRVDQAVVAAALEVLQPLGVEAALTASEQARLELDEKRRALELGVEKARYEADRARRQFDAVEPENRLVADELERRWNAALAALRDVERRLAEHAAGTRSVTEEQRRRILALGADVQALWNDPRADVTLKKRILRTLLVEIVFDFEEQEPPTNVLRLHWAGGAHTVLRVPRNRTGQRRGSTDRAVFDLVRELATVCDDRATARILNLLGYRTGAGNTWNRNRVCCVRNEHGIPVRDPRAPRSWVTANEAARILSVSTATARRLVMEQVIPARQVVKHAPWKIERADLDLPRVQEAANTVRSGRRRSTSDPRQDVIPFPSTT